MLKSNIKPQFIRLCDYHKYENIGSIGLFIFTASSGKISALEDKTVNMHSYKHISKLTECRS